MGGVCFRASEWGAGVEAAHEIIFSKLPPRTKAVLAMPLKERAKVIRERKALLAAKAAW